MLKEHTNYVIGEKAIFAHGIFTVYSNERKVSPLFAVASKLLLCPCTILEISLGLECCVRCDYQATFLL